MLILTQVIVAFELLLKLQGAPPLIVPKNYLTEEACKADGTANGSIYLKENNISSTTFTVVCNPVMGDK